MKDRPILFSAPMVRAILEGRKTMTRRVVKPQPREMCGFYPYMHTMAINDSGERNIVCPYGEPGDRLWVRETFWHRETFHADYLMDYRYCATEPTPPRSKDPNDYHTLEGYWRKMPSIFMPRDASRITLEMTGVDVERLHEITLPEAVAEGCETTDRFADLWAKINGRESWDANPWVWVVEFRRVEK